MEKPRINPYVALAMGVISISTSAIFVKLSSAPSGTLALYRLFFSVILMLPIFLLKYVTELRLITKRDWMLTIASGIILALHFILWFESLNYTSVASSTVLVTLQPLFAFAGTFIFFKERLSSKAILSGITAVIGSFVISWGDFKISGDALFGDILALTACALITFYLLFGQTVRKRVSLITYTFVVYSISSITLFLYVLAVGEPLVGYDMKNWVLFVLLALFPTLLGHSFLNWSIKWVSASTISVAILFEPIGATVLAFYLLGERVFWTQVFGGIIVLAGIIIFLVGDKKLKMAELADNS